jgi:glycosyltransferase involved in cell wall biosynthesis
VNILFVVEHYYPYIGGVEKLFKNLADKLVSRGHRVRVITTRFNPSLSRFEIIDGVEVYRVTSNRFIFSILGVFKVYKLSKGFDIFHTSSYNAAFPSFIAAFLRRKKAIITFHEVWGQLWFTLPFLYLPSRFIFWVYEQIIVRLPFYRFLAVSQFTAQRLARYVKQDRIVTIHNGVVYPDTLPYKPVDGHEFQFIYFGRIGVSKGLDLIIKASARLINRGVNMHLTLVIPRIPVYFYVKVIHLLKKNKIHDKVTIKHNLSDSEMKSELLASNAVLVPSYSEGFCFAAVESIALGIPIISSGRGALKEVVSGTFIEMEEHSVTGLEKAMEKAINNQWNTTEIRKFDLERQVDEYINLYNDLAKYLKPS